MKCTRRKRRGNSIVGDEERDRQKKKREDEDGVDVMMTLRTVIRRTNVSVCYVVCCVLCECGVQCLCNVMRFIFIR